MRQYSGSKMLLALNRVMQEHFWNFWHKMLFIAVLLMPAKITL